MKRATRNFSQVGISEIAGVIPQWFIGVEKLAMERKLPLEYVNGGLGVMQVRIPYGVSLEKLVVQALKKINYKDVDRFFFATESDYDIAKAALAIKALNHNLEITVVPFQLKFACLAGVQSLLLAAEYATAQQKPAIVIVADRSVYGDKKAEVTQGSGVVVLRIERNPKILALNFKNYGQYVEDIDDFRIPLKTAPLPQVNGTLSKSAYLKCVSRAFQDCKVKTKKTENIFEQIDYFALHTPFPKMVIWAAAVLWRSEKYKEKDFLSVLNKSVETPGLFKELKKLFDEVRNNPEFKIFFEKKFRPGLKYNPYIGNCYNASVFISLISILEKIKKGESICLLGYGSGAGAIAVLGEAKKSYVRSDLFSQIKRGKELEKKQYQNWKEKIIKRARGKK